MALPNEFELLLINQLRITSKIFLKDADGDSSDMFLVRWLRARKYHMKKSEQMLRESKRWRKENKIDRILDNGLDTFFKVNFPFHLGILDKRGRPVVILPIGKWDLKAAVKDGFSNRFRTFVIQCMEAVMKSVENRDLVRKPCAMPVSQFSIIVDFSGFRFHEIANFKVLSTAHQLLSILESNYPETLAHCICINCPRPISNTMHTLLRSVISVKTSSNIRWFGKNQQSWTKALGRFVPEEEVHKCELFLCL